MCSFITQHNATDVASFEGACNRHADCRNVHQSSCPSIEHSFLYHKPSPKVLQRIWQYIQPASQMQTTCNHTSQGPPHPASSPPRSSETSHPDSVVAKRAKDGFLQCSQWGSRKQEFQISKLDFIIRITKPRQQACNVWISVCPLTHYTCGTAQTWEFRFFISYAFLVCYS